MSARGIAGLFKGSWLARRDVQGLSGNSIRRAISLSLWERAGVRVCEAAKPSPPTPLPKGEGSNHSVAIGRSRLVGVALIARRDRKCVRLLARSRVERRW